MAGLDAIFDQHLNVEDIGASSPHYKHVRSAVRRSTGRSSGFDARQLVADAYDQLVSNLARSPRFAPSGPSQENWRFAKQLGDTSQNSSPEVTPHVAIDLYSSCLRSDGRGGVVNGADRGHGAGRVPGCSGRRAIKNR